MKKMILACFVHFVEFKIQVLLKHFQKEVELDYASYISLKSLCDSCGIVYILAVEEGLTKTWQFG